jgi:periplasmic protein TonB
MSAITVNAFPPLHAFNSSRSWFLAFIVLLHAGFFYGLTHGVTIGSVKLAPPVIVVDVPVKWVDPKPVVPPEPRDIRGALDPVPLPKELDYREQTEERAPQVERRVDTTTATVTERPGRGPEIVLPRADGRYPFTEPEYPGSEIRQQHEGTVWLSVEVLPSGRIGQVRVDQSSGYERLDDSAAREARKWRMKPGMEGGVAKAMWLKVPVKFQLKN